MKEFEMVMLICFGASWPASLWKSWRSGSTKGKSIIFLFLIGIGYLSGIIYKIGTGFDYVSWFYILNFLLVAGDVALFFRNRNSEKTRERDEYAWKKSGQGN